MLSSEETWATHRRIIGSVWSPDWVVQKIMFAERDDDDKRVASSA